MIQTSVMGTSTSRTNGHHHRAASLGEDSHHEQWSFISGNGPTGFDTLGWTKDSSQLSGSSSGEDADAFTLRRRLSSRTKKPITSAEQDFFDSMENNIRRKQNEGASALPNPEPHQWSNFIGGTLNTVSREHKPHYMFRTTPYIDMDILHTHIERRDSQPPPRIPLQRRNSWSSVELCLAMDDLDVQGMIKATCLVLHHHICEGCAMAWPIDPRFNIFNDPPCMEGRRVSRSHAGIFDSRVKSVRNGASDERGFGHAPTYAEVLEFYSYVFRTAQLEKDCVIMSLVYIERVLTETAGKLRICRSNWRSILLCGLILASKIWDDLSMWNCDFSKVGRCPLRRINELEVAVLQVLQYNVRVASSLFASYYFRLRHWCIILGVETPGLYEASPPHRRSESFKATEAMAIAEAAAKAARAAKVEDIDNYPAVTIDAADGQSRTGASRGHQKERDNLLQIGGPTRGSRSKRPRGVPGISHRLDGRVYRSCYSRLPPSLDELVDMRQTDAGGRIVRPREHVRTERNKSFGNCLMRRQKKKALQNLILAEVGDVRSVYDVSEGGTARPSSKVDLAQAAGCTGVGAILGVGISGLVQVVRHKTTGVNYAMKTLRLGRLEDFHKTDELRNEIMVMSQLNHPNICRLLEIYESPTRDSICLILELCTGGELLTRLNKLGHYSERKCCGLVRKMLLAVRHCHAQGICLRDLKLENWVFESSRPDAELKLIDFGLSRFFGQDEVMHVPVGTPYSIAPECLFGAYTVQCDLWSIGVLTFMLLAGTPPFTGRDDFEVLEAVKGAQWRFPIGATVSQTAKEFVSKLLVVDPSKRMTMEQALNHPWMQASETKPELPNPEVMESLHAFEALGTIKKLLLRMIAFTLEAWQVESLRAEFRKCDLTCNGLITLQELRQALSQQGLLSTANDNVGLGEMLSAVQEPGGAGVIRYNDFLAASLISSQRQPMLDDDLLQAVFEKFDRSRGGLITGRDLRMFLGKELDDDDIDKMLREAGLAHGGSMNFEEFKDLMRSTLSSPSLSRSGSCP